MRLAVTAGVVSGITVLGLAAPWRDILSAALNQLGQEYPLRVETVRSLFADIGLVEFKPVANHPHGAAAASRSAGSYFISRFAKELGRDVCYFQCSSADRRNGHQGGRNWFWIKDSQVVPTRFCPKDNVIGMVDVDQYIDMPGFLTEYFQPTIIYTFQPSAVSADRGEYSYTFDSNNQVVYRVGGGAEYRHPVWSYDADVVVAHKLWAGKSWLSWRNWIPFVTTAYLVDKIEVDADHQLIGLFPIKRWFGPLALCARFLKGSHLRRTKVVQGEFTRLAVHRKDGVYISTGKPMTTLSGTIPASTDDALASMARTLKAGIQPQHVKDLMKDDKLGAVMVYEFHAQKLPPACHVTYSGNPAQYVRGYQFSPSEYDADAKHSLVSYMAPLLDGGFCPDVTMPNARQAVVGRILKVKSHTRMTKFLYSAIDEFVTLCYREADVSKHSLSPVDPEIVYERQNRPTQKRILAMAEYIEGTIQGSNFIKREAYQKCSDPRIITTINGHSKYRYSRYIYSFADNVLKAQSWYAFGKKPRQIAARVAQVCMTAEHVTNTDFSRFDGTLSEVPRALERCIMMYGFQKEYHMDLLELMRQQQNMPCYINIGDESLTYNSGLARSSGSPETAAFNSIINAFCAYLAWRMTSINGCYTPPAEAWVQLGVYGGDDGLTANLTPKTYVRAASRLGLTLTLDPVQRGETGVMFLSRKYGPLVWHGDPTSMCDLPRALTKFHLCVAMPRNVSNITKLIEKAYAYYLSDKHTPILGDFVTAVVSRLGPNYIFRNVHNIWNAQTPASDHYPNGYIQDDGTTSRPDWMNGCLIPGYRTDLLSEWLDNAPSGGPDSLVYFLSPPTNLCEPVAPVVSEPVVLDGDLVIPPVEEERERDLVALRNSGTSRVKRNRSRRR